MDWPVAVTFIALFLLLGFIEWMFSRGASAFCWSVPRAQPGEEQEKRGEMLGSSGYLMVIPEAQEKGGASGDYPVLRGIALTGFGGRPQVDESLARAIRDEAAALLHERDVLLAADYEALHGEKP